MSTLLERHGPYLPPLLVGRLADTTTTLYGLTVAGLYERNPLVAALIEAFGPGGGMLFSNLLTATLVAVTVEVAITAVGPERSGGIDWSVSERFVLDVGYLPAVALSFGAALYNVGLIATT